MGILDFLFGNPSDAYKSASKTLQGGVNQSKDLYNQGLGFLNPYMNLGSSAGSNLNNFYSQMSDPQAYYNQIMGGYSMSPAAQFQKQQQEETIRNSMASRGLSGSGAEMKSLMDYGTGLTNQDQQQYLSNILGIGNNYSSGLSNLFGTGAQASGQAAQMGSNLGQNILGASNTMAGLDYNSSMSNNYGLQQLLGLGAGIATMPFGGGSSLINRGLSSLFGGY